MKKTNQIISLIFLFVFLIAGGLSAQEIIENKDLEKDNNDDTSVNQYFSAHKPNYILLYNVYHQAEDKDFPSTEADIKFQLSFKHNIFWSEYGDLYIAYTQKSFWHAYDESDSRPFRETNYNPELFFRTKEWNGFSLDFGGEHESNGQTVNYDQYGNPDNKSRSWNRFSITPRYRYDFFTSSFFQIEYKLWDRVNEDPEDDENPGIKNYYGSSELRTKLKLGDFVLATMARRNFTTKKGAFEANVSYPIITGLYIHLQFFEGYGESLYDYNNRRTTYGIGLMFTR